MNLNPIFVATLAGSATLLGFLCSLYFKAKVKKVSSAIVSIAAGVLLGMTFFHLMPEAFELLGSKSFMWILAGFILFFLIETLVGFHACREGEEHKHDDHHHVLGAVAGTGIFLHSFLDGLAIAVAFMVSPTLGLVTALGVLLHEFPEGIFTFSILLHNKMSIKKASWWTVAVSLATPLGALIGMYFLQDISQANLGVLVAITAGSFLYISASDLIPETHKSRSITISTFMILGLLLSYGLNTLLPHGHEHEEDHDEEHELHDELEIHEDEDHDDHEDHDH